MPVYTHGINDQGHLEIGGCDAVELAEAYGTPLYVFDEARIRDNARRYRAAFTAAYPDSATIYAGKAFLTMAVCRLADEEGLWLDVVSGGELYTALKAGFPPERIFFHGNHKSEDELALALEHGVGRIVVDSVDEIHRLGRLTDQQDRDARVHLRVTPDVDTHTHQAIRTGHLDTKFGLPITGGRALKAVEAIRTHPRLRLLGLHCHIGSQLFDQGHYDLAVQIVSEFYAEVTGRGIPLVELNLGGGLGVPYTPDEPTPSIEDHVARLAAAVRAEFGARHLALPMLYHEPGRSIVGDAGVTLYRVSAIKCIPGVRTYVTVDGGMNDNPRVALYQATYTAQVANKAGTPPEGKAVTIAGRCCETGDVLVADARLPHVEVGDLIALFTTGAYTYSMASHYNRIPTPAVVWALEGRADLVVRRESYDDLIAHDLIPERLRKVSAART